MQERLLDKIAEPFNIQLPERSTMDQTIDEILGLIRQNSESLREDEYYVNSQWVELFDDLKQQAVKLYVFQDGGRLLISTNGKVENASWSLLQGTEKMIISAGAMGGELYNLAFLDGEFFILKRHGDPRAHTRKYRLFVNERVAARLEWNEALERLYSKYRNTSSPFIIATLLVVLTIILFFALR